MKAFLYRLFPLATLVTPNILEAASILGIQEISDVSAMQSAAEQLLTRGTNNVLLKGGHLKGRSEAPLTNPTLGRTVAYLSHETIYAG